ANEVHALEGTILLVGVVMNTWFAFVVLKLGDVSGIYLWRGKAQGLQCLCNLCGVILSGIST
ncbi:hypothetical protein CEJ83_20395, partial [Acinetobacter baumannii]